MLDTDINNIYRLSLAKKGKKAIAMDYMIDSAGLIKEISRNLKGDNNIEKVYLELAKVSLSVDLLVQAYNGSNSVLKNKHELLIRLRERLKE